MTRSQAQEAMENATKQIEELNDKNNRLQTSAAASEKENRLLRKDIATHLQTIENLQRQLEAIQRSTTTLPTPTAPSAEQLQQQELLKNSDVITRNNNNSGVIDSNVSNGQQQGRVNNMNALNTVNNAGRTDARNVTGGMNVSNMAYNADRNDTNIFMQGILEQMRVSQIKVNLPKYSGNQENPVEFLQNLEKYFIRKNIQDNEKILIVEEALQGKASYSHLINVQFFRIIP